MNSTLSKVLIFAAGAAIGSAVTWKLLDAKYAKRAEREIKEVKEYYKGKYGESVEVDPNPEDTETVEFSDEEIKVYSTLTQLYKSEKGGSESMDKVGTPPYVIPPEEFDTMDDYDTESLTYYTDGVLADDYDKVIDDVENMVGKDFANHFGEYEDDSVFVRNERLKTDYEILMDYRPYSDVVDTDSNPKDDE